jgi:hypothetical protein
MFRLPIILFVPLLTSNVTPAAPIPKDADKRLAPCFPTQVGSKWVVVQTNNSDPDESDESERTLAVTAVEEKNGAKIVTIGDNWKVAVSEQGLFEMENSGEKYSPPLCLLKLPSQPGDKWTTHPMFMQAKIDLENMFVGLEVVEVPAGKFTALRVDSEFTECGKTLRIRSWFAPGIGPIKTTMKGPDVDVVVVLKSFAPGKE